MLGLFRPTLGRIESLLLKHLDSLHAHRAAIDKVVAVGGLADSPCMRLFLVEVLRAHNHQHGTNVKLYFPMRSKSAAGVSKGGLWRVMNKANGPSRTPRMSIGIHRHIPFEAGFYPEDVLGQETSNWELNQRLYIHDTIDWIIKKVS
jgi:hypothetical protein